MGLLTPQGPPLWHPASPTLRMCCRDAVQYCESRDVSIVTLAVLSAIADPPGVPCTILGMKDVSEIKDVLELTKRLDFLKSLDTTNAAPRETSEWLQTVCTASEYDVLRHLQDSQLGPFAPLSNHHVYGWDGVAAARQFWQQTSSDCLPDWHIVLP
jgi:hypothetical protein